MKHLELRIKNSKLRITLCLLPFALCLLAGCQTGPQAGESMVELVEAEAFPEHLVGVWRNASHGWGFMFEPDGRISRLTHTIGRMEIRAEEKATFPLVDGGQGDATPGRWYVEYNGTTDELTVEIELADFNFRVFGHWLRGSSQDFFMGAAPEPGQETWRAHWISFPNYVATTASEEFVDHELPHEPGMEDRGEIVFEKLDLDAYRQE